MPDLESCGRCSECYIVFARDAFARMEWKRADGLHYCWNCVMTHKEQGSPMRCNQCGVWKNQLEFRKAWRHGSHLVTRICEMCCSAHGEALQCSPEGGRSSLLEDPAPEGGSRVGHPPPSRTTRRKSVARGAIHRSCSHCTLCLPRVCFNETMWTRSRSKRRCLKCQRCQWGMWRCRRCQVQKPKGHFRSTRRGGKNICDECRPFCS